MRDIKYLNMKRVVMLKNVVGVVIGLLLSSNAFAENLVQATYGKWYGYPDGVVSISKRGIDEYANRTVDCGKKKYKIPQVAVTYSGSDLIEQINMAIEMSDDPQQLKVMSSIINANKKYNGIDVNPPICADGGVTFVQISNNTGLYIESGGDDAFYLLKKK